MEKKPLIEIDGDWYCPSAIIKLSRNGNSTVVHTSLRPDWPIDVWDEGKVLYNKILEARGNIVTPSISHESELLRRRGTDKINP